MHTSRKDIQKYNKGFYFDKTSYCNKCNKQPLKLFSYIAYVFKMFLYDLMINLCSFWNNCYKFFH